MQDVVDIKGALSTTGSITMPNGNYLYGGNNVCKRQGVYLNGVHGGGYYYNTTDYSNYVSSEAVLNFALELQHIT
jgi:hypothetical protein